VRGVDIWAVEVDN